MKLHLFNQSDPVLLTIEDTKYKPLISLRQGIMVIEAELTAADKEIIIKALGGYTHDDLIDELNVHDERSNL
jgi:hypothetical protein